MKGKLTSLLLTLLFSGNLFAQGGSKISVGLNVGPRLIFGDRTKTGEKESLGLGGGIFMNFRILPFADLSLNVGLSQLRYTANANAPDGLGNNFTAVGTGDLTANFEIISKGMFRPYISLGGGAMVFRRGTSIDNGYAYFGGGGFRIHLNQNLALFLGSDYRLTTTDRLDGGAEEGTANDGFLSVNSGVVYSLGGGNMSEPNVIADERAPFYEVDDMGDYDTGNVATYTPADDVYGNGDQGKDMTEYVRLKSRLDELAADVDSREGEISKLRKKVKNSKGQLTEMERQAAGKGKTRLPRKKSMSGFSDIYQQALANMYNKDYTEAISLFRLLTQQFPNHSMASSCQYWVGQCYFEMKKYQEAATEFYKVLAFTKSLKKDDALFHLGKSYLQMGSGDRARESFLRLMKDYPGSEYTVEAKGYVARL